MCGPMIDTIKGGRKCKFAWTRDENQSFEYLKKKVAKAPILVFTNFNKVFTIECDGRNRAIGGVLSQEGKPVAFFSEKLNEGKQKYSTYDLEIHALVQCLRN